LFVDDEPRVLQGLRLGFWSYRDELTTEYCTGGAEALELLAGEPFDAVVSDMRMPGMDGEALLRRVQLVHPDVVRVVLSGQTDRKVAARMVHVAHQFLSKPCDVSVIRQRLGESLQLRPHFAQTGVRALVSGIGQLPVSHDVKLALLAALDGSPLELEPIAAIVLLDSALCAKVLQLANSAFFGPSRQVSAVCDAVRALGAEGLRVLLASGEAVSAKVDPPEQRELQARAHAIAAVAHRVALDVGVDPAQASAAGLLSMLGARVFCTYLGAAHAQVREQARELCVGIQDLELGRFGVTHARVGAYLASLWGLEPALVAALHMQSLGSSSPGGTPDLGWVLQVACGLVEESAAARPRYFAALEPGASGLPEGKADHWMAAARAVLPWPGGAQGSAAATSS
jgi:HD-like signal output (HDOD) protein/CheY-like chemotaxis protein